MTQRENENYKAGRRAQNSQANAKLRSAIVGAMTADEAQASAQADDLEAGEALSRSLASSGQVSGLAF